MACELPYQSSGAQGTAQRPTVAALKINLTKALRLGNIKIFTDSLTKYNPQKVQVRLFPQEGDSETVIADMVRAIDTDVQNILRGWDATHPSSPMFDTAIGPIREALGILDNTQSVTPDNDSDGILNKSEVADLNSGNLRAHLAEVYGLEAFDITASLKQYFEDMISSVAYFDINSGTIVPQNNPSLNNSIKNKKAELFRVMVQYMKESFPENTAVQGLSEDMYTDGHFNSLNYYLARKLYYSTVIAGNENFKPQLQQAHIDRVKNTVKHDKTTAYKKLVQQLLTDQQFVSKVVKTNPHARYTTYDNTPLYMADHYSTYYAAVKKFVEKYKPELVAALVEIESPTMDILTATNAYTMLTHFDGLLKDVYGDQISIAQNTAGFEADIPNKYSYHQDTAHERKGWQTSEDIGSEKHTSRFTNAVVNMLRVYDYKTGEFLHRRVDSTSLIVAARNVVNAISAGKLSFLTGGQGLSEDVGKLQEAVKFLHSDPVVYLQQILELLFERQNRHEGLANYIENRKTVNDIDLSILKSVYEAVFNRNSPQSFYSQNLASIRSNNPIAQSLLEEIAGFIDRNVTVAYLETMYDFETGDITVAAKKKYFNNLQLYKTQVKINEHVNGMSEARRKDLQNKYGLNVTPSANTRKTLYSVQIGDETISIAVPNEFMGQILSKNPSRGPQMTFVTSSGLFDRMGKINLIDFRYKIENGSTLNDDEKILYNILQFLDDTLDLGILRDSFGLQTLYSYKEIYNKTENMSSFLMPLLKLGIRAAYASQMHLNSGEQSLRQYLEDVDNPIYRFYKRNASSKLFTERFRNLKYVIASYTDDVLGIWTDAQSILRGEASKATTKDKQGNSIPNNSVAKMGGILQYYLGKQFGTNTGDLLFAQRPDMILETFHDLEVTNMQGESKSIKAFSNGELFFHAIFNKFWGSYLRNNSVIVQPTTYSDKTTFLNWEIKALTDEHGNDIIKMFQTEPTKAKAEILKLYLSTIGSAYSKVAATTTNKLQQIAAEFAKEHGLTDMSYKEILHQMTEKDLGMTATKLGLTVELNKDYKLVKNKQGKTVVGLNHMLDYNARLFTNPEMLTEKLEKEKVLFLEQLILNNCTYQVLDGQDTIDMYTEDTIAENARSRNPIISAIKSLYADDSKGRSDFMKNWVDESTGKLILAKQGGMDIISVSDTYNKNGNVVLNPLFETFFYTEGLLSNNLRFSLTGFEVNHPSGKKQPLAEAKKIKTLEDWNNKYKDNKAMNLLPADWAVVSEALKQVIDVDGLNDLLQTGTITGNPLKVLSTLLNDSYTYDANTAQGTQFKRNVIIPATLQYCMQNIKDGVPPKIRCAVIRDEEAPVWNYRGDHEGGVDACDGSAQITPFQCILENKSLGSQAVGFIKKPIWHAYDAEGGTAFLAKFATDTITNEAMQMSLQSNLRLYNIFKKATNIQWGSEVDLTKSLIRNVTAGGNEDSTSEAGQDANDSYNNWFRNVILNGQKLFYQDKYGAKIEIRGFNKTVTQDGKFYYYTSEHSQTQDASQVTRKYHIFYDDVIDGKLVKSIHTTVDTWQKAVALINKLNEEGKNAHTVNSLFELHAALGGAYCVDSNGNPSEFNNEVVVNFMNNVGWLKPGVNSNSAYVNQATYEQPLKKYHIGYILNNTAVKNGAKNINEASAWTDDSDLMSFEVDSDGLGMQMNADHDIINSELTEFSQVIAATAAYGYTFDNCYEIFQGLARTAFQASERTLLAVESFIKKLDENKQQEATSELYDAVGRIIFLNQSIKDNENLTNVIMQAAQKVFNKYKDHTNDEVKIPFSDPNVYSEFISTLASTITRQSIKRQHPGSGCVMVPAYNMIQYFETITEDGRTEKLMANDIVKRARAEYKQDLLNFLKATDPVNQFNEKALDTKLVDYEIVDKPWRNDPSRTNKALRIYLKGAPEKGYFELVKDLEYGYYSVHFVTGNADTGEIFGSTAEERVVLYDQLLKAVPDGAYISTWGQLSEGGLKALNKLGANLKQISTRDIQDRQGNPIKIPIFLKGEKPDTTFNTYRYQNLEALEKLALERNPEGTFSAYYTAMQSNMDTNSHLISIYTSKQASKMKVYDDQSYFIPSDIVDVLDANGQVIDTIDLNSLDKYYRFKEGFGTNDVAFPEGAKFRTNTTRPRNLRPSLIRWQYNDNGVVKYKNIFDLDVIANAYKNPKGISQDHREKVQNILHDIHNGTFIDNGKQYDIIEGTLENSEAELIMSNIYKETFGIENESLSEILAEGEDYFQKDLSGKLTPPSTQVYDMVFLKENGKHTMITIGNVNEDGETVETPMENTMTNEKDEIHLVSGGRELFKVGKWNYVEDVQYDKDAGLFVKTDGSKVTQTDYRLKDGKVQKRFNYVTKYNVTRKTGNERNSVYRTYTLYKIADVSVIKDALASYKPTGEGGKMELVPASDMDAIQQQSHIIMDIYLASDYKLAQINPAKLKTQGKRNAIANALTRLTENYFVSPEVKELLDIQLKSLSTEFKDNLTTLVQAKKDFAAKEAHKKWVSFQDSLKFISSRIPAQTLQSFMAMRCVAWTNNSKNMAYVSHFQTYLQGSDYDIDKAYIMGQSYDSNSIYVKWSPFFDYTSVQTLEASKTLTVPKGIDAELTTDGVDITNEINQLVAVSTYDQKSKRLTAEGKTEAEKVSFIKTLASILRKVERNNGNFSYNGQLSKETINQVLQTLIRHEKYHVPANVAEAAYKNVASANIYAVSHDIRNRDQAYTAIAMNLMRAAAEKSPKGEQAAVLSMLNPLTKYIMQYQNLVGKNVIGITANGEKFWFNAYYYWTQSLLTRNEDELKYLQFSTTLNRIKGRASGTIFDPKFQPNTVTHLPDLDARNAIIRNKLLNDFGGTVDSMQYRYVDQLISQLLSAATDNAKELILAKINAGTNFAKMYIYLMTMGYDVNDIAAFMTSPVAEFVDGRASINMFQENSANSNATFAIDAAQGMVRARSFLHGVISGETEEGETYTVSKIDSVAETLEGIIGSEEKLRKAVLHNLNLAEDADLPHMGIDQLMQNLILVAVQSPKLLDVNKDINLREMIREDDSEINNYVRYCQDLIMQLRDVKSKYPNMESLIEDAKEFKKVFNLASEMSSIASGYLGLNQGLPTDQLSLIKRLNSMRKVISDREKVFGISGQALFGEVNSEAAQDKQIAAWDRVISELQENNSLLDEDTIRTALTNAYEAGIMNHFDVITMLTNEDYKQVAKDYLHVLKGTVNVIDMMDVIPHYKQIMNCLRAEVVANKALASKSRMIAELMEEGRNLSESQLAGMIRFIDKLNILEFLDTCDIVSLPASAKGFDKVFDMVDVDSYDLSTIEGISGFKHYIETEFLDYLKANFPDNGLVKHLTKITVDGQTVLATDIDLLNPEVTTTSKLAYDAILSGTAALELKAFNSAYSVLDMLQLYNLIVNNNQYGGERLTTIFKVCSDPNNILERYLRFTSEKDYDLNRISEYQQRDYQINAAPIISPSAERFHSEPYIKVKDPVWGYIIKKYDERTNSYSEYNLVPAITDSASSTEQSDTRKVNFIENCPFEMPSRFKIQEIKGAIDYNGDVAPDQLKQVLQNLSISGKILIIKEC